MNFFNRALRNVTRRMTKSILLAVTFFMIGNLVILGLGVSQAAENAKVLTRQKMKAVVNLEVDYEKYFRYINDLTDQDEIDKAYRNYPKLNKEMALALSEDEHVKTFNFIKSNYVYSRGFENVPLGNEEYTSEMYGTGEDAYKPTNIVLYGNILPSLIEIEDGTVTIEEGRFYNQSEIDEGSLVAVISKELAETNNFKVGDNFKINGRGSYMDNMLEGTELTKESFDYEFEIVGIYDTINNVDPNSENFRWMSPTESPKNYIYIPATAITNMLYDDELKTYEALKAAGKLGEMYSEDYEVLKEKYEQPEKVVFLLDDPLNVDKFVSNHKDTLSEYTRLNANNDTFKTLSKPLDTLSFFANVIVWIVTVNAIVIISLVTALTLKTREFEIGVLLSLGVSKLKVILQLFAELILVAVIGFSAAILSGSLIAGSVGKTVLEFQQAQQDETQDDDNWGGYVWKDPTDYFTTVSQEELFAEYEVTVSPIIIVEIYIFGLMVVFVAILIPSAMIMRLNPKQILLTTN